MRLGDGRLAGLPCERRPAARVVGTGGERDGDQNAGRKRCERVTHDDLLLETRVPNKAKHGAERGRMDAVS